MKQLDKSTERKLTWLILPLGIVALIFFIDVLFDLNLNTIDWIEPALLACALIPIIGFSIAYIKQKCWGMFAITVVLTLIMVLNMTNFFIDLIFHR